MLVAIHPAPQKLDPSVWIGSEGFGVVVHDALRAVGEDLDEA